MGNLNTAMISIVFLNLMFSFLLSVTYVVQCNSNTPPNPFSAFSDISPVFASQGNCQTATSSGTTSGTTSQPTNSTQVQSTQSSANTCGMGIAGGGILGTFFIPIPILGTLAGIGAGALIGCYVLPSLLPQVSASISNAVGNIPILGDVASVINQGFLYFKDFLIFTGELTLFGVFILNLDPIVGAFLAPFSIASTFIIIYEFIMWVRGVGLFG